MSNSASSNPALPVRLQDIEQQLKTRFLPSQLEVLDESAAHAGHSGANAAGFGSHFRVRIASAAFDGQTRVASHRLVYDEMQNFFAQGLHALAIEIVKPDRPA